MRKLVLAALSMLIAVGFTLAAEVVLVSFDGKELKVKDGDKESTYKVTDKTTYKQGDADVPAEKATKTLSNPKAAGKMKIDITVEKDTVTAIKLPMGKKKTDK